MGQFLVDAMCGRLARYLRFCGHDAAYAPDRDVERDTAIADLANAEDRIVITRDRSLAACADEAILVDAHDIDDQLRTVMAAGVALTIDDRPRRCGRCNGPLKAVLPGADLPAYVPTGVDPYRCARCGQLFWRGSHWDSVRRRLARIADSSD